MLELIALLGYNTLQPPPNKERKLELRQITREILKSVEETSGLPVHVIEEPKLGTLATVRMARGTMPAHVVLYKPMPGEPPDYLICYQCGFVLRKFAVPAELRFDLVDTTAAVDYVRTAMLAPDGVARKYNLQEPQIAELQNQWLQGLRIHLLSIPLGMRVAQWLANTYPELQAAQQVQVLRELAEAKAALSPKVRAITPAKVYTASQCISAAYAIFWAAICDSPDLKAPYRSRYEKVGDKLLAIWRELPDDPAHDVELVDRWADALGLAGWYTWVPYESPA